MAHYIGHFGERSSEYLRYRPTYPKNLFLFLSKLVNEHDLAWDSGTGNGQAAVMLSEYFKNVVGTDINQNQLEVAKKRDNISYYAWPSEKTGLPNVSVDLITVAQAVHWFNLDAFYEEVRRVAKPNAVIAVWCYSLATVNPDIDKSILRLYGDILGDKYWSKQRRFIDEEYKTLPFPFKKLEHPEFSIQKKFNFEQILGYLDTWSAVKEFQKINQQNPLDLIYNDFQNAWGDEEREVSWRIHLLIGKVH